MEPLSYAQKALNQRLLAEHTLKEDDLRALWNELNNNNMSLEDALRQSNAQLAHAGLEIAAIAMKEENVDNGMTTQNSTSSTNATTVKKYFSLINKFPDDLAKETFGKLYTPAEHALVRLWLAALVETTVESRAGLLNLRSQLSKSTQTQTQATQPTQDENAENQPTQQTTTTLSLSLQGAEDLLERLLEEQWLEYSSSTRRQSMQAQIQLAPRTYLELGYLLTQDFGVPAEDLPQQFKYI